MNTELKEAPVLSRKAQKKQDVINHNIAYDIANAEPVPKVMKFITDHPYYKKLSIECEKRCLDMEADIRSRIKAELTSELIKILDETVLAGRRKILNLYGKKYGRNKYIPH
jgi:hypothetical protein